MMGGKRSEFSYWCLPSRIPAAEGLEPTPLKGRLLGEESFESGIAVVEDAAEVGSDEEAVNQGTAGDGVFDFVADERAAVALFEGVFVMPVTVRSTELVVGEEVGRIPAGDFAFPPDGDAVKFELVLNTRTESDDDRPRREDTEVEEGRSELFQMFGGGEEGENPRKGMREPEFGVEGEEFHELSARYSRSRRRFCTSRRPCKMEAICRGSVSAR